MKRGVYYTYKKFLNVIFISLIPGDHAYGPLP